MREHNMAEPCPGKGSQSTAVFNRVIDNHDIYASMALYNARFAGVKERVYTILQYFPDPIRP